MRSSPRSPPAPASTRRPPSPARGWFYLPTVLEVTHAMDIMHGECFGPLAPVCRVPDLDTAIAIRTAVIANGKLHVQAGAGIVVGAAECEVREWSVRVEIARAGVVRAALALRADHAPLHDRRSAAGVRRSDTARPSPLSPCSR